MDRKAYLNIIRQHLQTTYLLDEKKAEAMIPVFINTLKEHVDHLAEQVSNGSMEDLSRAIHAVKGALLNMGLTDLAKTAYVIERESKKGNTNLDFQNIVTDLQYTVFLLCEN